MLDHNAYLMRDYDEALYNVLTRGAKKSNKRTGEETLALFGVTSRYDMTQDRLPVVTRRKVWPEAVFSELLWFLEGSTNNDRLVELGCKYWTPWVSKEFEQKHGFDSGELGPVYGFQLRHFGGRYPGFECGCGATNVPRGKDGVDQLAYMMDRLKKDPSCRRILFSLWNPQQLDTMRLAPCHILYQVLVDDDGFLTGIMTQRSCDFPVGVPANIQFYSALTMMVAQQTGFKPKEFVHHTNDAHIYCNQIPGVEEYLGTIADRPSPSFVLKKAKDIYSYKPEDFKLAYDIKGPVIKFPIAV